MDILSLIGVVIAFSTILLGQALEGGHAGSLFNLPALLIVGGGTLGAIMLQSPLDTFKRAMNRVVWVMIPPKINKRGLIKKVVTWSNVARREGLLGLEGASDNERDPFAKKGLQLLVDGAEPDSIRAILEVDLVAKESEDLAAAKLFEAAGGYAPTIGILGAVMGLIHVMENLSDPSKLGAGIATAFVATIYGVGLANLVLLPVANKIKAQVERESRYREMIIEGIVAIAEGENPRSIENKLRGYLQ